MIQSGKISRNWGKIFFLDYLKGKGFYYRSKKIISLITGELVYVYSTFLVITKVYIFFLLYFTSVLLLIMRSHSASIAWTATSTAAFYHYWSYTEHGSDLSIRCVVYVLYKHNLYLWNMRICLIFDINVNDAYSLRMLSFY